ncbi:MAG: hypothetical protein H0W17_02580 [Chloroflexi bacterium]|nr:hypothetical protein [Chloroflexota bacterium]
MPFLAYIDPGSGSMLLQVILAGVLAVPFFFRRVISDGLHRIRGTRGKADEATRDEGGEDATSDR